MPTNPTSKTKKPARDPLAEAAMALAVEPNPFIAKTAAYTPRLLASVSLPYRKPTPAQLDKYGAWVRTNGSHRLVVQQGPNRLGIPFGMFPRLFLIWLTTEVFFAKTSHVSLGNNFWAFCKKLDVNPSRGPHGSGRLLIQQMAAVLDATFSYGTAHEDAEGGGIRGRKIDVAQDYDLFWTRKSGAVKEDSQMDLFESYVDIGERFKDEILNHYVPLDLRVVGAIKKRRSPMELDIYQWMSYRLYAVTKQDKACFIPKAALAGQFPSHYARPRRFWADFTDGLVNVLSMHRHARVTVTAAGIQLEPSPLFIPERKG